MDNHEEEVAVKAEEEVTLNTTIYDATPEPPGRRAKKAKAETVRIRDDDENYTPEIIRQRNLLPVFFKRKPFAVPKEERADQEMEEPDEPPIVPVEDEPLQSTRKPKIAAKKENDIDISTIPGPELAEKKSTAISKADMETTVDRAMKALVRGRRVFLRI